MTFAAFDRAQQFHQHAPQLLVLDFALAEARLRRAQRGVRLDERALCFVALAAELAQCRAQIDVFGLLLLDLIALARQRTLDDRDDVVEAQAIAPFFLGALLQALLSRGDP
jgi:hypothetical protein